VIEQAGDLPELSLIEEQTGSQVRDRIDSDVLSGHRGDEGRAWLLDGLVDILVVVRLRREFAAAPPLERGSLLGQIGRASCRERV
jgi:hypothetical protein